VLCCQRETSAEDEAMAEITMRPKCPECGKELDGPDGALLQALKIEYGSPRHPGPAKDPESRTVDAIFCPNCGRLFTLLAHPVA
jgi:rRNA maturation protein Nop10